MANLAEQLNAVLAAEAPAVLEGLSPFGRRAFFPREIPFQAAEARDARYNATIGQITDGHGSILTVPALQEALAGLPAADRNAALLYSPIDGLTEVRQRWAVWQRRNRPDAPSTTLPQVTVGLSHAVAIAADLFGGAGKPVAVPEPFWGNYRQIFGTRLGADVRVSSLIRDGAFDPLVIERMLGDGDEPAVAVLNFPSNPGGYTPNAAERGALLASLARVAEGRNLVVVCDDAYLGLVYEPEVPADSIFWDLVGLHPNLVPVKIDGATKEFSFFGGRVGFLTFGLDPGSDAAAAIADKVKGAIRATVGSPVAASQAVLLQALRRDSAAADVEALRRVLAVRYRTLKDRLADIDAGLLQVLPFNSGCFAVLEIDPQLGVDAEDVRRALLADEETGVVAIPPRYIRLAFCSMAAEAIPELVTRVERGVAALARRPAGAPRT